MSTTSDNAVLTDRPKRHKHKFSALWWHFGSYGPQDVHVHDCFTEGCDRVLIANGRGCGGPDQPHRRKTLGAPDAD